MNESMTDHIPSLEINVQPGYADLIFTNPKTGKEDSAFRLNPRELIMTRDLLLKFFPIGSEPE
jgi:hypothetical protein